MRAPLLLAGILAALVASSGCLSQGGLIGEPAPPFSLVLSDGQTVNETTFLGKFVILDLMATWCGPCVLEVAHLQKIQSRYGDDVQIISIGDPSSDTPESLAKFAEQHGATWPHAVDPGAAVSRSYKVAIIPKLVIIDPSGMVVFEDQGEISPAVMARVIDPNAPGEGLGIVLPALAGLALGFVGVLNPYRRLNRQMEGRRAEAWAGVGLALLAFLAWNFSSLASSRATYGSLFGGALTLGALVWWFRVRTKEPNTEGGHVGQVALDRAYEVAPHFALTLVLALNGTSAVSFFFPLVAFLGGATLAVNAYPRLPEEGRVKAGLIGLALAGLGLLLFGSRIIFAYSSAS